MPVETIGMSMVMFAMARNFKTDGIACNSLWRAHHDSHGPVRFALVVKPCSSNRGRRRHGRDAAYAILNEPARTYSAQFLIDDRVWPRAYGISSP